MNLGHVDFLRLLDEPIKIRCAQCTSLVEQDHLLSGGRADVVVPARHRGAGFDLYLAKPVKPPELEALLRHECEKRAAFGRVRHGECVSIEV